VGEKAKAPTVMLPDTVSGAYTGYVVQQDAQYVYQQLAKTPYSMN
jgi:hypothetical protein